MYFFVDKKLHQKIYSITLLFAFATVVWGKMFITISTLLLFLHLVLEGNYKEKIKHIKSNKGILLFAAFFIYPVIALINTENISLALYQINASFPMIVFPIAIISRELLSRKQFFQILLLFIVSLLINSFYNIFMFYTMESEYADIREISRFMSHIRYSLYLNMAIAVALYLLTNYGSTISTRQKAFLILSIIWFGVFILIMHSMTGLVILLALCIYYTFTYINRLDNTFFRRTMLSAIIFLFSVFIFITAKEANYFLSPDSIDIANLDIATKHGNRYSTYTPNTIVENGHYQNLYICIKEVKEAWEKRSNIPFYGRDKKGQILRYTIYRYMASKNLRKDFEGVKTLTNKDIRNIESGMTNYRFENRLALNNRIYEVFWEIDATLKGGIGSYHSFTQRFIFYSCVLTVIKENLWFGTGTGDLKNEMNKLYETGIYNIPQDLWRMPHSQYLTILGRYGIFGFSVIFFFSIVSIIKRFKYNSFLITTWLIIVSLSMLIEDTLNNYDGLALFSIFGALFFSYNTFTNAYGLNEQD